MHAFRGNPRQSRALNKQENKSFSVSTPSYVGDVSRAAQRRSLGETSEGNGSVWGGIATHNLRQPDNSRLLADVSSYVT